MRPGHSRARLRSVVCWVGVGVGLAISLQFLLKLGEATRAGPDRHSDFITYYAAATVLRAGASPYDPSAELAARVHAIGRAPAAGAILLYFHPPPFLLFILPFTLLSPWGANLLWTIVQVIGVWPLSLRALAASLSRWEAAWLVSWSLAWLPMVVTLKFGQLSLVLLLAFVGFTRALRAERQPAAGLWLALLSIKPLLAVAPLALLIRRRHWRAVLVAALTVGGLYALTLTIFGFRLLPEYVAGLREAAALQSSNLSWRTSSYSLAAIGAWFGRGAWPAILLLDCAAVLLWLQILKKRGIADAAYAAPIVGILVSPHVLVYDLVLCLATLPALLSRPVRWSVPLLLIGFAIPWIGHLVLRDPSVVVIWQVLVLLLLLGAAEAEQAGADRQLSVRRRANADARPASGVGTGA